MNRPNLDAIERSQSGTYCQWGCDDTILSLVTYARELEADRARFLARLREIDPTSFTYEPQ